MPVDSHITMPASIMRGFFIKGKTKETYSFNIKTYSIDEVVIKEHQHYFQEIEPWRVTSNVRAFCVIYLELKSRQAML